MRVWSSNAVPARLNSLIKPFISQQEGEVHTSVMNNSKIISSNRFVGLTAIESTLYGGSKLELYLSWKSELIHCLKWVNTRWREAALNTEEGGQTGPVSYSKWALINRPGKPESSAATANMMNSHCGGVTANVSDKQKQQRIKASKLLTSLQQLPPFLTYFLPPLL